MILIAHTVMPLRDIASDPEIRALFSAYTPADAQDLQVALANGVTLPPLVLGQYPGDDSRQTGKITLVDGYNRLAGLRAAGAASASVLTYRFDDRAEMLATAIRLNAKRRHLTPDQRASAGLRLAELLIPTMDKSRAQRSAAGQASGAARSAAGTSTTVVVPVPAPATTTTAPASAGRGDPQVATSAGAHKASAIDRAAAEIGASPSSIRAWKIIQDAGIEAVRLAIRHRKLSLRAGAQIARQPAADQPAALATAIADRVRRRAAPAPAAGGQAPAAATPIEPPPPVPVPPSPGAGVALAGLDPGPTSPACAPAATPGHASPAPASASEASRPSTTTAPAAGGVTWLAAACEAMTGDWTTRLHRHLAEIQAANLSRPDRDRCAVAVRALLHECLRYLLVLNGATHPALVSAASLDRLAAERLSAAADTSLSGDETAAGKDR